MAQDGAGGDGEGDEAPEPQPREKVEKVSVVAVTHAVVYPRTVVVHLQHAPQPVGFIPFHSFLTFNNITGLLYVLFPHVLGCAAA